MGSQQLRVHGFDFGYRRPAANSLQIACDYGELGNQLRPGGPFQGSVPQHIPQPKTALQEDKAPSPAPRSTCPTWYYSRHTKIPAAAPARASVSDRSAPAPCYRVDRQIRRPALLPGLHVERVQLIGRAELFEQNESRR